MSKRVFGKRKAAVNRDLTVVNVPYPRQNLFHAQQNDSLTPEASSKIIIISILSYRGTVLTRRECTAHGVANIISTQIS